MEAAIPSPGVQVSKERKRKEILFFFFLEFEANNREKFRWHPVSRFQGATRDENFCHAFFIIWKREVKNVRLS